MKFPRYIIVFILILCVKGTLSADSKLISEADSAYSNEEYAKAIELYSDIAAKEGVSSSLFVNLGNSYAKIGDYGNAMVCYLRALRLNPGNTQAKDNISFIESKVTESNTSELRGKKYSLDADEPDFLQSLNNFIARDHLSNSWSVAAVIMFLLFMTCLSCYVFSKNVLLRKIGFFGGGISFFFAVMFIIFAGLAASYVSDDGVIVSPKVKLKTEASASSKEHAVNLTRGTRMKILDTYPAESDSAEWYKVKLNSDFVGWIQDGDFTPVDFY